MCTRLLYCMATILGCGMEQGEWTETSVHGTGQEAKHAPCCIQAQIQSACAPLVSFTEPLGRLSLPIVGRSATILRIFVDREIAQKF